MGQVLQAGLSAQSHAGHQCLRAAPVGPASTAAKSTRMESSHRRKYLPLLCPIGLAYVVKAADEETLTRAGCGKSACPVRRGAKGSRGTDNCGQFNSSLSPLPTLLQSLGAPHPGFLSPSFLMRETNVLGLMLSNSAAPPGP